MSTTMRGRSEIVRRLSVAVILAVVVAACGGGSGGTETSSLQPVSSTAPAEVNAGEETESSSPTPSSSTAQVEVIASALDAGVHEFTLAVNRTDRSYKLYVPSAIGAAPLPMVLAFHTWGMNPSDYVDGEWRDLAEEHGFLLVAPAGLDSEWAVAQSDAEAEAALENSRGGLTSFPKGARDVVLVEAVLDDVATRVPVDGDRIYVTGDSLGGWMASRVACELADRLAALGPSLNSVLYSDPCASSSPISVISVGHATDQDHSVVDARAAIESWASHNGCSFPPSDVELAGDQGAGIINEVTFSGCTGETSVKMLAQVSGFNLNEVETLWEFFAATSRSG